MPSVNPNQPLVPLAAKDVRQESNHQTALRPIMLAGTGSDVGKSVIATALCRIFVQDGYHPAPFKAQNMALNSYATPDGLEIGRAQAVQAEACRLAPHTDMNPLMLKPNSNHTTQVVLHGQPIGNRSAYDFWSRDAKGAGKGIDFRAEVCAAYDRLAARYAPIILEGAGSISEINLRDHDLVNLPMARHANAAVILVADIDRGGVFASCLGSIMLQSPEDRKRICGIIVNKFRGDLRLFDEGRRMLEHVCGVPVLGVVPQFEDIHIDAEDSVVMERRRAEAAKSGKPSTSDAKSTSKRVAVCLLKHLSNFTDFDALERDPRATLFYTDKPEDLDDVDIIIIPGTKATLDDIYHLRRSGMASAIMKAHSRGTLIIGICGGFQMLGQSVCDPLGIEGGASEIPGLGLLPMQTTMEADKVTRQVEFTFRGVTCKGYEIHQGHSTLQEPIVEANGCMGTYIHGCFDNEAVRDAVLASPANVSKSESVDYLAERDHQYDLLAEHVRKHLDMEKIYEIIK